MGLLIHKNVTHTPSQNGPTLPLHSVKLQQIAIHFSLIHQDPFAIPREIIENVKKEKEKAQR